MEICFKLFGFMEICGISCPSDAKTVLLEAFRLDGDFLEAVRLDVDFLEAVRI